MIKHVVIASVVSAALIGTSFAFWQEATPSRSSTDRDRGSGSETSRFTFFSTISPTTALLRTPEVRTELNLEDDKAKKLDEINAETARERARLNVEYNAKLAELNKKADADALALLNDAQRRRTEQIRLQQQGLRALNTDAVAEKLGLTKTRFVGCGRVIETHQGSPRLMGLDDSTHPTVPKQEPDPSRLPASGRFQEHLQESTRRAAATHEKLLAVLTPEQKAKWSELTGEPFQFPSRSRSSTRSAESPK